MVFKCLGRLRRQRHATAYPDPDSPTITADDTKACLDLATQMHQSARQLVDSARLAPF